jgi:competence protein ComEC
VAAPSCASTETPLREFAIAFLAGQLGGDLLSPAPAVVVVSLVVWLVAEVSRARPALVARGLAAALSGAFLSVTSAMPPEGCWLPARGEVRKAWIEAVVDGRALPLADGVRVFGRVRLAGPDLGEVCGRVLLTIGEPLELRAGDRLRAHASLRRPVDFRNPRAYAYARSLARERVWSTGAARRASLVRREAPPGVAARVDEARLRIRQAILGSVDEPAAGLLRALVIGEQAAVAEGARRALTDSGLAHLLSVSGLHIAAVWGVGFAAVRWLLARSEWLLLSHDVRALAAVAALGPAGAYAVLAGGSVPTARSIATALLLVAAWVVGRESQPMHALAVAAIAIAVAQPGSPASISFQLSFVAVFALVLLAGIAARREGEESITQRAMRWGRGAVVLSLGVSLATAPLVALHFQRASPIGVLTNPVLVPVLGVPATILGLAGGALALVAEAPARVMLVAAGWFLDQLVAAADAANEIPYGSFRVPMPTLLELGIVYGFLTLPWLRARRIVALVLVIVATLDAGCWLRERQGRAGLLRIRFLDVGQGDAAVLELPDGRVAVVDGGGLGRGTFDVGERVVAPALAARKIARVDVLIATHGDRDHQGGLGFLARELRPRELWIADAPEEERRLQALVAGAKAAGASIRRLRAGDRVELASGIRFDALHPPAGLVAEPNDRSLVLRLTYGDRSFLFAGDVEAPAESLILRGDRLARVDVLKVPHHGSASSSGGQWVERADPRVAVISVGAGNPYGAPSPEVVRRHRRVGARVLRTDRDGSVLVETDGASLSVRTAEEAWPVVCSSLGLLC